VHRAVLARPLGERLLDDALHRAPAGRLALPALEPRAVELEEELDPPLVAQAAAPPRRAGVRPSARPSLGTSAVPTTPMTKERAKEPSALRLTSSGSRTELPMSAPNTRASAITASRRRPIRGTEVTCL